MTRFAVHCIELLCLLGFLPGIQRTVLAAVTGPVNGGFEIEDGVRPFGWGYVYPPVYSLDPADAFNGNGSVKCNGRFYYQRIEPAEPERIHTIAWYARGETALEVASVQLRYLGPVQGNRVFSPAHSASSTYTFQAHSDLSPPGTSNMFVRVAAGKGWVWYDDVTLIDDTIANATLADIDGDTLPDRWSTAGVVESVTGAGPGGSSDAAVLYSGGEVSQSVAMLPDTYVSLSACLRSPGSNASADVLLNIRDENGNIVAAENNSLPLTASWEVHTLHAAIPPEGVFGEIQLNNISGAGEVHATGFTWAWSAAKPNPVSPNADGVRDESEITAAFSNVTQVTWSVLNAIGTPVTTPVVLDSTSTLHLTWDGLDTFGNPLPDGNYTGHFEFVQLNGQVAAATLPLEVYTPRSYPNLPNARFPEFITFAHGAGGKAVSHNPDKRDLIREKGMTDAWMLSFWTASEVSQILDLAQQADLKITFLPHDILLGQLNAQRLFQTLDEDSLYNSLYDRYIGVVNHPALRGFLCTNEPSLSNVDDALLVRRILQSIAPDKPTIANLSPGRDPAPLADVIDPSVVLVNLYALLQDSPAGFPPTLLPRLALYRESADNIGADFWQKVQAYTDDKTIRIRTPWPSEMRLVAYYPLSLGARGVGYFTFAPFKEGFYAMTDGNGNPSRAMRDMALTNYRLQSIKDDLYEIEWLPVTSATVTSGLVSEFVDPQGQTVLMVVNEDVRDARSITVNAPVANPSRVADLLTGNSLPFRSVSGGIEFDLFLAPGDARYVRLEP